MGSKQVTGDRCRMQRTRTYVPSAVRCRFNGMMKEFNAVQRDVTQPKITQPNTTQPNTTQPNTAQPNTAQPFELVRPRVATDKSARRSVRRPARHSIRRPARRSGKGWSGADASRLAIMAERQVPVDRIARKLQRSEGAVRAEAARRRIRLAPTEKQLYGAVSIAAASSSASELQSAVSSRVPERRNQASRREELTERLF